MRLSAPVRVRRIASRLSWTVADQVLSALSNVLLAIIVARSTDAAGFGAFSMAFLVFTVMVAVTRAVVGEPLQISYAAEGPRQFHGAVRSALGAAALIGVVAGSAAALAGLAWGGETGASLLALSVVLPGLLVQDTCRLAFFAAVRPRGAVAIDGLWTALMLAVVIPVTADSGNQVWRPVLVWGVAGTVAAVLGAWLLHARPRLVGTPSWILGQRRISGYLLAEYGLGQGIGQIGIVIVGVLVSADGVGALRAAQVMLGPLNILMAAAFMFAIPEIARRPKLSGRGRSTISLAVSGGLGSVSAAYALILLLIPDQLGVVLFGDTWAGAQQVLLPMCVLAVAAALAVGPVATLYGMQLPRVTFWINVMKAPLLIAMFAIGIPWAGATGAAWALALTELALLPVWFLRLRVELRRADAARTAQHETAQHETAPHGPVTTGDPHNPLTV